MPIEIGWFRCEACTKIKPVTERAWRSAFTRGFGVCQGCYAAWQQVGHRCPRCWTAVEPKQALGFFPGVGRFGHYACGGALLA